MPSTSSRSSSECSKTSADIAERMAALALKPDDDAVLADTAELFAVLTQRERPRLCPLAQPYDATLRDKISALEAPRAVRVALHVLNDDLTTARELCRAHGPGRDRTCALLDSVAHRRDKLYFESEQMWKTLKHPLILQIYAEYDGPLAFQRAIEGADGKRVSEAKRKPLEEAQFKEMLSIARWAIANAGEDEVSANA